MLPNVKNCQYYFFTSDKGNELPTIDELESYREKGVEPVIFLDSCVCLHIIRTIDYGKDAKNVDFNKLIHLKAFAEKNQISLNPFFGIMELCFSKGYFDNMKFWDFKYRIDFYKQIPMKIFKSFRYNYLRDYYIFQPPTDIDMHISVIQHILNNSYCALLKIRSLSLEGLSKSHAIPHLNTLSEWMVAKLGIMLGAEYKLGTYIWGGRTEFRKMIGLDCKNSDVKKKILGTVWDLFHAKNATNSLRLFRLLQENIYGIFVTNDSNLSQIFENFNIKIIKEGDGEITDSYVLSSDLNCPHFADEDMQLLNEKMIHFFIDRHDYKYKYDKTKVENLIVELEKENNI